MINRRMNEGVVETAGRRARLTAPHSSSDICHARLVRLLNFIELNLKDPELDSEMLQSVMHVSRPTLHRMLNSFGGVSNYIRERRVTLARERVKDDPDSSITFILYDLGFSSDRQFQRAFQAHFGMSAAQWRRRCLECGTK